MKDEEGYVLVEGGVRLYYCTAGSGPNEVIVPSACGLKADLVEPLARGRRLIFYDKRGRGGSDTDPDESHIWTDYEVRDLEAVRRHFGLERVSIMGWSYMGGVSALYAASHPERVERLILMCPVSPRSDAPYDDPEEAERKAAARLDSARAERLKALQEAGKDVEDPVNTCREHIRVYYPLKMGKPEALARMPSDPCLFPNEWPHKMSEHWRIHFPPASLERDWRSEASSIEAPTLVIHGTEDLIPLDASREWAMAIPKARLLSIPGVGHFPHLEAPEVFFPAVNRFLDGEWPEGAETVRGIGDVEIQ